MPKPPSEPGPAAGDVESVVASLRARTDLCCEDGLSAVELTRAEQRFGVRFPRLWRTVLGIVHPVALPVPPRGLDGVLRWMPVPDWRGRDPEATAGLVEAPVQGVLFDVEENGFWWPAWGARPRQRARRMAVARERLGRVPRLVPLWSHLYVSSDDGSPVLSIVQTDLCSPADSLVGLLRGHDRADVDAAELRGHRVEFWSDLLDWSQGG